MSCEGGHLWYYNKQRNKSYKEVVICIENSIMIQKQQKNKQIIMILQRKRK